MPHIDPETLEFLRFIATVLSIIVTSYGVFRIGKRLWRQFKKWSTRSAEPGE